MKTNVSANVPTSELRQMDDEGLATKFLKPRKSCSPALPGEKTGQLESHAD